MQPGYEQGEALLAQARNWAGTGGAVLLGVAEETWGLLSLGSWFKVVQAAVAEHRCSMRALQGLCEIGECPLWNCH